MRNTRSPNPVDIHVGRRIKTRRALRKMSQIALADKIGLTFQQVQKYERGANRISVSRLWQIAQILDVPVAWFFEGLDDEIAEIEVSPTEDFLEFASTVHSLTPDLRKSVQKVVKAISDMDKR